jgi:hypothetical protein
VGTAVFGRPAERSEASSLPRETIRLTESVFSVLWLE